MQPSSDQIVASIRSGLREQVLPHVDDQVALSVLRSVDGLLGHLAVRLEREPRFLVDDNAAARALLGLEPVPEPVLTVEELTRRNDELRGRIDELLATAHARGDTETTARIDAYLQRRLDEEAPFFLPAFAGGTY